jgi:hypothetical protein
MLGSHGVEHLRVAMPNVAQFGYSFCQARIVRLVAETISHIVVKPYGRRHWAIYADGALLAVTLYKKGANSVADLLRRFLAPRVSPVVSLPEIGQWDSASFQQTFLNARGIHAWSRIRSGDLEGALAIAARKLPAALYASFAFASMPSTERLSLLHRLAQGELSAETYWPILESCFVDALEQPRKQPVASQSAIEDFHKAYPRLSPPQQAMAIERVMGLLSWEHEDFTLSRRNPPVIYNPSEFSLLKYGAELADESLQSLLAKTVGHVGFYCFYPHLDELGDTITALGANGPLWYYLTLDFQTEAITAGNPLPQYPWAFTKDPLPIVRRITEQDVKILSRLEKPPVKSAAFDYCGSYYWDEKVGPHIVLRVQRIADCARRLNLPFEQLFALAWIHQFSHLVHLGVPDADGRFNARMGDEFAELVAQWATWRATEKHPALRRAFSSLSRRQSLIFHSWKPIRNCTSEEFRSFLWCLRTGRQSFERLSFMRKLFALPNRNRHPFPDEPK